MNCRPNDLAVVVHRCKTGDKEYDAFIKRLIGRIVRVTKCEQQDDEICWTIRHSFWMRIGGDRVSVTGILDKHLQPIRGVGVLPSVSGGAHTV